MESINADPLPSVMISFLTPLANDGISYSFGFVFVGCNLAAGLLVWFFLYETRCLSLENVDLMYSQPELKPWTSHKWVPPGYITREQRDPKVFKPEGSQDDRGPVPKRSEQQVENV